jgi:superfamily II DNA or RNA helicase
MSNKQKGDDYERYILDLLFQNQNRAWLWNDIPHIELRNAGILGSWNEYRQKKKENRINNLPDLGCDILLFNGQDYVLVQCKNYAKHKSVRQEDLAGIIWMVFSYQKKGIVYYTSKLSQNILLHKPSEFLQFIRQPFLIEKETTPPPPTKLLDNPYFYQVDAYNALKGKHRAICQLPCGMGKTLVSIMVAKEYPQIIVLSPLRAHCLQNMERFMNELGDTYKALLVDSDGTRNVEEVSKFIAENSNIILSFTYDSCDVLMEVIELLDDYYVVIDEFHNLSLNDVFEDGDYDEEDDFEESPLHQLLYSDADILFLSATPRIFDIDDYDNEEVFGKVEYKYEMGDAIRNGYLCDYEVFVPTIQSQYVGEELQQLFVSTDYEDTMKMQAEFILRGMYENGDKKCIVYMNTQEECVKFCEVVKRINNDYFYEGEIWADSITSSVSDKKRKELLKEFIEYKGKALVCSVRILNECVDIPECDSILITNPGDNKISNIQRLNRATRRDKNNPEKKAHIYLWCDEISKCADFFMHLKEYDDSFTVKKVCLFNDKEGEANACQVERTEEEKEYQKLDKYVIGVKRVENWFEKLEQVKVYIEENKKLPPQSQKIGKWLQHQKQYYKRESCSMKNDKVKKAYEKFMKDYPEYFLNYQDIWFMRLDSLKTFISENGTTPPQLSKDVGVRSLAKWLGHQQENYIKKDRCMKNDYIRTAFESFLKEYEGCFVDNIAKWYSNCGLVVEYTRKHGKLPSHHSKDDTVRKLGAWLSNNLVNRKDYRGPMRNKDVQATWDAFKDEYHYFFELQGDKWQQTFSELEKYVESNGCLPPLQVKDKRGITLAHWLLNQRQRFKQKDSNTEQRQQFEQFTEKYSYLFMSNKEKWYNNLKSLREFIKTNNKLPSSHSKDIPVKNLGVWLGIQKRTYQSQTCIMEDEAVRHDFKLFLEEHRELLFSQEEKWYNSLNSVVEYIDIYNKVPSSHNADKSIKQLGGWLTKQKNDYKTHEGAMQNPEIRQSFEEFLNSYKDLLLSGEEVWYKNLSSVDDYIETYNKLPSMYDECETIKYLARWLGTQKDSYSKQKEIMKKPQIRQSFEEFTEKHKELFISNEELWYSNLNCLIQYIKQHDKLPPGKDKDPTVSSLGVWLTTQKRNYKTQHGVLKLSGPRKAFEDFMEAYKELLITNKEKWYHKLNSVSQYINTHGGLPYQKHENKDIRILGIWLTSQRTHYKTRQHIMKESEIREAFESFMLKYPHLFIQE